MQGFGNASEEGKGVRAQSGMGASVKVQGVAIGGGCSDKAEVTEYL